MKLTGICAVLLSGITAATLFTACGSSGSSNSTRAITQSAASDSSGSTDDSAMGQSVSDQSDSAAGDAATSSDAAGSASSQAADTSDSSTASDETTIEEQILLDTDDVKITATGYETDDLWGDGIKLLIENNSSVDIGVNSNATIVNNYMITDIFSATVAAGKKSNETLNLSTTQLEASGIDNIGQIEIYFHIYDSDTYDTILDADPVTIRTNKYDVMDTQPNDDGQELYNADGIRIVGKYVDEDSIWGNAIVLYLENNTDQNVTIQCDDMSVNGFMVTPYFSCDVYAGKMAISDITLMQSDLDDNNITSVDDVELKFHIYNSETYDTIVDTDPITFSTK